jgi:putative FmdB family regulatory protein
MPLYEYECKKCHHRFEKIQKFSDPHMKKCPDCRGPVALVISAPAVQFKGSGWYVTDYPKKSSGSSSDNESSKDSASKDSASKDSASKDSASRESAKDSASKKDGKSKESKAESKSSTTKAEKN